MTASQFAYAKNNAYDIPRMWNDGEHCTAGCEELGLVQSTECPSVFRKRHTICTPSTKLPIPRINNRVQCGAVVDQGQVEAPTSGDCKTSVDVSAREDGSGNATGVCIVKSADDVCQGISNSVETCQRANGGIENKSDVHVADTPAQTVTESRESGVAHEAGLNHPRTKGVIQTLRSWHSTTTTTTCHLAHEPASRLALFLPTNSDSARCQASPQPAAWERIGTIHRPKQTLEYCRLVRECAPKQPLLAVRPSTCHGTRASPAYASRRTAAQTKEYGHSSRCSDRHDFDSLDDYLQSIGRYANQA